MEKKVNTRDDMLIEIIMRQTDYTKEIAAEKLVQHKYNILSIVREYMSSSSNKNEESNVEQVTQVKSTSQLIYGEIRNMMSNASANYRRKKEFEEYRKAQIMFALTNQQQTKSTNTVVNQD